MSLTITPKQQRRMRVQAEKLMRTLTMLSKRLTKFWKN